MVKWCPMNCWNMEKNREECQVDHYCFRTSVTILVGRQCARVLLNNVWPTGICNIRHVKVCKHPYSRCAPELTNMKRWRNLPPPPGFSASSSTVS